MATRTVFDLNIIQRWASQGIGQQAVTNTAQAQTEEARKLAEANAARQQAALDTNHELGRGIDIVQQVGGRALNTFKAMGKIMQANSRQFSAEMRAAVTNAEHAITSMQTIGKQMVSPRQLRPDQMESAAQAMVHNRQLLEQSMQALDVDSLRSSIGALEESDVVAKDMGLLTRQVSEVTAAAPGASTQLQSLGAATRQYAGEARNAAAAVEDQNKRLQDFSGGRNNQQALRSLKDLSSGAHGVMFAFNLLNANMTGLLFSMIFMQFSAWKITTAFAAASIAVGALYKHIDRLRKIKRALDPLVVSISNLGLAADMAANARASAQEMVRMGFAAEDAAKGVGLLYGAGGGVAVVLKRVSGLAAQLGRPLEEVAQAIADIVDPTAISIAENTSLDDFERQLLSLIPKLRLTENDTKLLIQAVAEMYAAMASETNVGKRFILLMELIAEKWGEIDRVQEVAFKDDGTLTRWGSMMQKAATEQTTSLGKARVALVRYLQTIGDVDKAIALFESLQGRVTTLTSDLTGEELQLVTDPPDPVKHPELYEKYLKVLEKVRRKEEETANALATVDRAGQIQVDQDRLRKMFPDEAEYERLFGPIGTPLSGKLIEAFFNAINDIKNYLGGSDFAGFVAAFADKPINLNAAIGFDAEELTGELEFEFEKWANEFTLVLLNLGLDPKAIPEGLLPQLLEQFYAHMAKDGPVLSITELDQKELTHLLQRFHNWLAPGGDGHFYLVQQLEISGLDEGERQKTIDDVLRMTREAVTKAQNLSSQEFSILINKVKTINAIQDQLGGVITELDSWMLQNPLKVRGDAEDLKKAIQAALDQRVFTVTARAVITGDTSPGTQQPSYIHASSPYGGSFPDEPRSPFDPRRQTLYPSPNPGDYNRAPWTAGPSRSGAPYAHTPTNPGEFMKALADWAASAMGAGGGGGGSIRGYPLFGRGGGGGSGLAFGGGPVGVRSILEDLPAWAREAGDEIRLGGEEFQSYAEMGSRDLYNGVVAGSIQIFEATQNGGLVLTEAGEEVAERIRTGGGGFAEVVAQSGSTLNGFVTGASRAFADTHATSAMQAARIQQEAARVTGTEIVYSAEQFSEHILNGAQSLTAAFQNSVGRARMGGGNSYQYVSGNAGSAGAPGAPPSIAGAASGHMAWAADAYASGEIDYDSYQYHVQQAQDLYSEANRYGIARGGLVKGPTRAWVGEEGPEVVLPLSGAAAHGSVDFLKTLLMGELGMRAASAAAGGTTIIVETKVDFTGATLMSEDIPSKVMRKIDQGLDRASRLGRSRTMTSV